MTPGELREELADVQERLRSIEATIEVQKQADVRYRPICHELAESWEAVERAIELLDEIAMGVS